MELGAASRQQIKDAVHVEVKLINTRRIVNTWVVGSPSYVRAASANASWTNTLGSVGQNFIGSTLI